MTNQLDQVSMNGRMAYLIMCIERFLTGKYPDRDWSDVARKMWLATSMNWADWSDLYSCMIPDVLFQYSDYSTEDFTGSLTLEEYHELMALYSGITEGIENDPTDQLNWMLNLPLEMAMIYEGTVIGDGSESMAILAEAEKVLKANHLMTPDPDKVMFSRFSERNGWGDDFDGKFLSIILNHN